MSMKLGERFRRAREEAGLSQGQVAEYVETGQGYISDIELDKRWPSTWTLVTKLALRYRVSLDWLFGLTDDPRPAEKRSWTPESETAVDLIDSLPAAKRSAALAVLKAAIELDRIEDETNLEPVGARQGGGVTIPSEANIQPQVDLIAEKDRLLALTDKMFSADVAAEVRRLVESGQGFTDADIERLANAPGHGVRSENSKLLEDA